MRMWPPSFIASSRRITAFTVSVSLQMVLTACRTSCELATKPLRQLVLVQKLLQCAACCKNAHDQRMLSRNAIKGHDHKPIIMVADWFLRKTLISVACIASFFWFWIVRQPSTQHRYNNCPCLDHFTPQITQSDIDIGPIEGLAPKDNATTLPDLVISPYAYVFYATDAEYACSVLVNIDRLNNVFHTENRIIVLVKPTISSEYLSRFTAQNATVIPYEPPRLYDNDVPYYTNVLLKLAGFRLHQYVPSLKRILILDSDQIILQSLDHVFSLPAVDLAAPRAYWQGSPGFTSAFLLVSLSDRLWKRIETAIKNIKDDIFDMDLLNKMFGETAMILPGDYCTLNSQWETNNIPHWWQGSEPPRDPFWKPSRRLPPTPDPPPIEVPFSLKDLLSTEDTGNLSEADKTLLSEYYNATARREMKISAARDAVEVVHKQQVRKDELKERGQRLSTVLVDVYENTKVMHFTALAKPWQKYLDEVKKARPDAHPLFAKGFELWRTKAAEVCPRGKGEYVV